MNLATESAFAAWLSGLETLDGYVIHTGQSGEVVPGDETAVIASCEDSDSPVSSLYLATVRLIVATPAHKPESLETHRTVAEAVRAAVADPTDLGDAFAAPVTYRGLKIMSVAEQREENRWLTTITLRVGVSTD